jgi:hypothetical protein
VSTREASGRGFRRPGVWLSLGKHRAIACHRGADPHQLRLCRPVPAAGMRLPAKDDDNYVEQKYFFSGKRATKGFEAQMNSVYRQN